jgi:hypothetical protein
MSLEATLKELDRFIEETRRQVLMLRMDVSMLVRDGRDAGQQKDNLQQMELALLQAIDRYNDLTRRR